MVDFQKIPIAQSGYFMQYIYIHNLQAGLGVRQVFKLEKMAT